MLGALYRRMVTLEDGRYGHLTGQGDVSAIAVQGERGRGALLALHGFAGTPNEVRMVTEVAARLRLLARAPRLAGHDANIKNLLNATWSDWVRGAVAALFELEEAAGTPVVVAGISMGALLAAHLAAAHPHRVAGLVAMSNATRLRLPSPGLFLMLCAAIKPFDNDFYVPKDGADIRDASARLLHMTYDVTPIRSAIEVRRAGRWVRKELAQVKCPTLVVHGQLDRVCPVVNAYRFAKALGTTDVEIAIMPRSGHIVTADFDRHEVERRVEAFVRRVARV